MRAVDDHVAPVSGSATGGVDSGQVVLRVPAEPHLYPAEAVLDVTRGLGLELCEVVRPEEPARVSGTAPPLAAEESPHRHALLLAAKIPEGDVEPADRRHGRALPAVPPGELVEPAPERFGLGRVAPDQMRREVLLDDQLDEIGMAVRRPVTRRAAIGLDEDERRDTAGDMPARISEPPPLRVVEAQVYNLDVLDLHGPPSGLVDVASAIAGFSRSGSSGKTGRLIRANGSSRMSGGVGPGRSSTKKPFITSR